MSIWGATMYIAYFEVVAGQSIPLSDLDGKTLLGPLLLFALTLSSSACTYVVEIEQNVGDL